MHVEACSGVIEEETVAEEKNGVKKFSQRGPMHLGKHWVKRLKTKATVSRMHKEKLTWNEKEIKGGAYITWKRSVSGHLQSKRKKKGNSKIHPQE